MWQGDRVCMFHMKHTTVRCSAPQSVRPMTSGTFTSELPLSKNGNTYVCGDGSASCRIGTTSGDITLRGE